MLTTKSIATISYNSSTFLKSTLNTLYNDHIIDFYIYIKHQAESNETKNHYHIFMIPTKRLDTTTLREKFQELDLSSDIPLGVMPFRNSRFIDWHLYAIHDANYLISKMTDKEYCYSTADYKMSDKDYFLDLLATADYSKISKVDILKKCVSSGLSFSAICVSGLIPVQQISQYKELYNMINVDVDNSKRLEYNKEDKTTRLAGGSSKEKKNEANL